MEGWSLSFIRFLSFESLGYSFSTLYRITLCFRSGGLGWEGNSILMPKQLPGFRCSETKRNETRYNHLRL